MATLRLCYVALIRPIVQGVFISENYFGHPGGIAGFRPVLNYSPEFDTVVAMLYNNDATDPEQSLTDVLKSGASVPARR